MINKAAYLLVFLFSFNFTALANDADGKLHLELGKLEAKNQNYEKAIEHFKQCVYLYTGCAYNIGATYEKIKQTEQAIPWYDIAARLGLPQAKKRLIELNHPIPDNDLEREFISKNKAANNQEKSFSGLTLDALNALISGYNRGADSVLRSKPRNASCTTVGNTTDCYEY